MRFKMADRYSIATLIRLEFKLLWMLPWEFSSVIDIATLCLYAFARCSTVYLVNWIECVALYCCVRLRYSSSSLDEFLCLTFRWYDYFWTESILLSVHLWFLSNLLIPHGHQLLGSLNLCSYSCTKSFTIAWQTVLDSYLTLPLKLFSTELTI